MNPEFQQALLNILRNQQKIFDQLMASLPQAEQGDGAGLLRSQGIIAIVHHRIFIKRDHGIFERSGGWRTV